MAGLRFGATLTVSAPASLPIVLMQFSPPSHRLLRLLALELYTTGSSVGDAPIVLEVGRHTTTGTGFFTSASKVLHCIAAESILTNVGRYTSIQPTFGTILATAAFHPQASMEWRPAGVGLVLTGATAFGVRQVSGPLVDITLQAYLEE